MRLLIVEDDLMLAQALEGVFRHGGYAVDVAMNGIDADHQAHVNPYDLVILDLEIPDLHGFEVLQQIRHRRSRVPILILSVHDTLDERVRGLNLGADDFMGKPFEIAELEARVRALVRRGHFGSVPQIRVGSLVFDTVGRTVEVNGQALVLPAKEIAIMELLLYRFGRVVDKQSIFDRLYGCDDDVNLNAVEIYIHRLRKKLDRSGIRIRTVRGLGYLAEEDRH